MSTPDTVAAIVATLNALTDRLAVVTTSADALAIGREVADCQRRLAALAMLDPLDRRHS